jgi:hypothetical protein
MDAEQFRKYGHQLIDFIADYYQNLDKVNVRNPNAKFGDLIKALPKEAPQGRSRNKLFQNSHLI